MRYLGIEDILWLHHMAVEDFGGMHGVRDENRLKSLIEAPQATMFGVEQYTTVYEKAAVYMRNIIGDHPFNDGNKRTGVTAAGVFLMRNGVIMTAAPSELEDFAVKVATDRLDVGEIALWLENHCQK